MKLQRLASIVLFLFVAGLVSTAAGEALHASADAVQGSHAENPSSSCPDPGDDGKPCGPACPCACCPGHVSAAAFVAARPSIHPPPSGEHRPALPDDLHPKDVHFHVFHPPRA